MPFFFFLDSLYQVIEVPSIPRLLRTLMKLLDTIKCFFCICYLFSVSIKVAFLFKFSPLCFLNHGDWFSDVKLPGDKSLLPNLLYTLSIIFVHIKLLGSFVPLFIRWPILYFLVSFVRFCYLSDTGLTGLMKWLGNFSPPPLFSETICVESAFLLHVHNKAHQQSSFPHVTPLTVCVLYWASYWVVGSSYACFLFSSSFPRHQLDLTIWKVFTASLISSQYHPSSSKPLTLTRLQISCSGIKLTSKLTHWVKQNIWIPLGFTYTCTFTLQWSVIYLGRIHIYLWVSYILRASFLSWIFLLI